MKILSISFIALQLLLFAACSTSEKKGSEPISEKEQVGPETASKEGDTNLKQNGDYTQLYALSEDCKLTPAQVAEALGYKEGQVNEKSNYEGNCWYEVIHPDGITVNYGIAMDKFPKDVVESQIKRALKEDLVDVRVSDSGDQYITRHPAQGFLSLLNTNYTNAVKVSYNYLNTSGTPLTDSQKEERKQNTYKLANYLINYYKK